MKSLILAEKPSVARDIARVLGCHQKHKNYIEGPKYIVTWALGHLIELKMPEDYNPQYKTWKLEDLPIIPENMSLKVIKNTGAQFKAIERLSKRNDIKDFIIATDAGREGELVARWIIEKIRWKKPLKRLWISSQTDRAIKEGFAQLKPANQYDNLYKSAVCRAEADWLIGLNVTRALTTKYEDPLSAGRVQTPTLAIILEREKEIQSFIPQEYWTIEAKIGPLTAKWNKRGQNKIFDLQMADKLKQKIIHKDAVVTNVNRKEKIESQPFPYDLTELQRDANRRFHFSAKKTANVLQALYERHKLVTYPRTDSRYLTTDMQHTMLDRLQALEGAYKTIVQPVLKQKGKVRAVKVFNNSRVTDHHAIIPTDERPILQNLSNDERKIYDLIVHRFLTLFYPPYKYENVQIDFEVEKETFTAKESMTVEIGFKTIENQGIERNESFSRIKQGQSFTIKDIDVSNHWTEPPKRFNESDLLAKMEHYGLGTPATRADIIEKLLSSETIDRQNHRLHPTAKGRQLIELVNEELTSPELTAKWEAELEAIAHGKGKPDLFIKNIRKQTKQLVLEVKQSDKKYVAHNMTGSKCPECQSLMKEVKGRDGRILVCSNRSCNFRKRKDPKLSNRRCPQCHQRMEIHSGKAGTYFQCRRCNVVEKSESRKKKVSKREEKQLLKKYSNDGDFGNSLADALKAALEDKK